MQAALETIADFIVIITVVDFIFDAIIGRNIVSVIRKMIRPTNNAFEAIKSQRRVTYYSIFFKLLSMSLLVCAMFLLHLPLSALMLYALATSIFIVNIILLITRTTN